MHYHDLDDQLIELVIWKRKSIQGALEEVWILGLATILRHITLEDVV